MAMVPSGHFFGSPLSKLEANGDTCADTDEPPQYNPKPQRAGRSAETGQASLFIISPQENHLLAERLELGSLEYRPHDCCQGRQDGVLPQPGWARSRTSVALLGNL
jgi:hypothetical protein